MLAYTLFINGLKASLNGYNKGLININDISYAWDNTQIIPPKDELIFNALPYDVGAVETPVKYNDYITIDAINGTFNINSKDPAYTYEGKDYDKVFRITSSASLVTVTINRGLYRYLDVIAGASTNRKIYINGTIVGTVPANVGAVKAVDNYDMYQQPNVIELTVSGGTDLVEIRLRPVDIPPDKLIFNALPYAVGPVDTPVKYNNYITIDSVNGTFNINSKDPVYTYENKEYDRVFRMTSGDALVTVQINRSEYKYLDVIAAATANRKIYINGNEVGSVEANQGAVKAVNNYNISSSGSVIELTASGGTDLVEIRLHNGVFYGTEWYTTNAFDENKNILPDPGCRFYGVITLGSDSASTSDVNATFENSSGEVITTNYGLKIDSKAEMFIRIIEGMPGAKLLIVRGNNNVFADLKLKSPLGILSKVDEYTEDNLTYQYYNIPKGLSAGDKITITKGSSSSELSAIVYVRIYNE